MSDPIPLKVSSNRAISRILLDAAEGDRSAPGAAGRALSALGAGTGAVTAAVGARVGVTSSAGSHWLSLVVVKWLGLGLVVGGATLVSTEYAVGTLSSNSRTASSTPSTPSASPRAAPSAVASGVASSWSSPAATAVSPIAVPPPREVPRGSAKLQPSESPPLHTSQPTVNPLEALRRVRAELAAHDAPGALLELDTLERQPAAASVAEEAAVLRIDALLALGRADARGLGEKFLQSYPRSAYAERVRAELGLP